MKTRTPVNPAMNTSRATRIKPAFRYQEEFAQELAESWLNDNREHVRTRIWGLKTVRQASFIAAQTAVILTGYDPMQAPAFYAFIHPNE